MSTIPAPRRSIAMGHNGGLDAATLVLASIGGFTDSEREMIARLIKMGRGGVGAGFEGWAPPLSSLVDRVFRWSEFDCWHAFFTACGMFPGRWEGLQVVPTAGTSVVMRRKYGQRKLELLLEWIDMLTRRPAEFGHYARRGRRVQIARQDDEHRCAVCDAFNGHEVELESDTMPPLHPGCRCVLIAAITAPLSGRIEGAPRIVHASAPVRPPRAVRSPSVAGSGGKAIGE